MKGSDKYRYNFEFDTNITHSYFFCIPFLFTSNERTNKDLYYISTENYISLFKF